MQVLAMSISERQDPRMSVTEHLGELRVRVAKSAVALILTFGLAWCFVDHIIFALELPLLRVLPIGARHLYFTGLADKFLMYFRAALFTALVASCPYWLGQVWFFVEPALAPRARGAALRFIFQASSAFLVGVSFGYFFCLPYGCRFLLTFGAGSELPLITLTSYVEFAIRGLLMMGLVFELPIFMRLLGQLGVIDAKMLERRRAHAFFGSSLAAAMIAPSPDLFCMVATMIPLYLLYEAGILAVRFSRTT